MPHGAILYARNSPVIFPTVRKWRSFCANTDLDRGLFERGTSDVRILERSVLASVRQRATSLFVPCTSDGYKVTMRQIANVLSREFGAREGAWT
jgi:hypothetical protein